MASKDYHEGVVWTQWTEDIKNPTKESKKNLGPVSCLRRLSTISFYNFCSMTSGSK